jgi:hypothetical protein
VGLQLWKKVSPLARWQDARRLLRAGPEPAPGQREVTSSGSSSTSACCSAVSCGHHKERRDTVRSSERQGRDLMGMALRIPGWHRFVIRDVAVELLQPNTWSRIRRARQSPRGDSEPPDEIFGPFGIAALARIMAEDHGCTRMLVRWYRFDWAHRGWDDPGVIRMRLRWTTMTRGSRTHSAVPGRRAPWASRRARPSSRNCLEPPCHRSTGPITGDHSRTIHGWPWP